MREAAAATIALKWARRPIDLAGHYVCLTEVHTNLLPVADVWVTCKNDDGLTIDKDALAALGVWHALVCCHGFGGYEDPRF